MTLAAVRNDLKESLEDVNLAAVEYLPERLAPPMALVTASEPYVEQGLTACLFKVSLDITLIAAKAANNVVTDALDAMIESTIIATGDWLIESVSQPFMLEANNAQYLAARVKVTQDIEIGG